MEGVRHDRFLELQGNPEKRTYQKSVPQETDVGKGGGRGGGRGGSRGGGRGGGGGGGGGRGGGTRKSKIPKTTLNLNNLSVLIFFFDNTHRSYDKFADGLPYMYISAFNPLESLRMPDIEEEPVEAMVWLVTHLMRDLQEAKMWPIKMASMKHQDSLRNLVKYGSR